MHMHTRVKITIRSSIDYTTMGHIASQGSKMIFSAQNVLSQSKVPVHSIWAFHPLTNVHKF